MGKAACVCVREKHREGEKIAPTHMHVHTDTHTLLHITYTFIWTQQA